MKTPPQPKQEVADITVGEIDELTGLASLQGFLDIAEQTRRSCQHSGEQLAMLYLKLVNGSALQTGRKIDDAAVLEFAELVSQAFDGAVNIARVDDDRFAVLVTTGKLEYLYSRIQRFVEAVTTHNSATRQGEPLQFHFGVQKFDPENHQCALDMLRAARQSDDDILDRAVTR